MTVQLLHGDCRDVLREHGPFDLLIADPPYGDTNCEWDSRVEGWHKVARDLLKPTGSLWVFGSMRFFLETGWEFRDLFRYAQDVVWEKHNGSAFHADRFKRVHEHVVQYYRADAKWAQIYNDVQKTPGAVARTVYRNKRRPNHFGAIATSYYKSEDSGPRIMRSVIFMRSCHGRAIHPTEKPDALLEILIHTSCPPGGIVGDMFAGSGAAGEAAMRAGRNYVGCELDLIMANKATRRLESLLPLSNAESLSNRDVSTDGEPCPPDVANGNRVFEERLSKQPTVSGRTADQDQRCLGERSRHDGHTEGEGGGEKSSPPDPLSTCKPSIQAADFDLARDLPSFLRRPLPQQPAQSEAA